MPRKLSLIYIMPDIVHQNAFSLGPGVYKFAIEYDEYQTDYKYSLKVYGTQQTQSERYSPPRTPPKPSDAIVIELKDTRMFQIKETLGDDFTESGDYGINTVTQELFFQDGSLGWIKVAEMFSSYPKAGVRASPESHDRAHEDTYYGKFIHVKKSEFRSMSTKLPFTEYVPSMKEVKPVPIDTIVGLAVLDGILKKHAVKLGALCQCFDADFATRYLKEHTDYRKKAAAKDSLAYLNGLSLDDIHVHYKEYKSDIEKMSS